MAIDQGRVQVARSRAEEALVRLQGAARVALRAKLALLPGAEPLALPHGTTSAAYADLAETEAQTAAVAFERAMRELDAAINLARRRHLAEV